LAVAADFSAGVSLEVVSELVSPRVDDGGEGAVSTFDVWTEAAPYSPIAWACAATVKRIIAAITARNFVFINSSPSQLRLYVGSQGTSGFSAAFRANADVSRRKA
jgi:hypothetical protein